MNPTPENSSQSAPQNKRRELTPEERALLPDFDDEARIGEHETTHTKAMRADEKRTAVTPSSEKMASGEGSALWGGAVCGCFGNLVLGMILLAFERAGLKIYGPGALAMLLGIIVLVLLAREWPRRVVLGGAAFIVSLLVSYGLIYLLVRPALNGFDPSKLPDVAPDETGKSTLQVPPPNAPQQMPPENQSNS